MPCGLCVGGEYQARCTRDEVAGIICNVSEVTKDHAKWPQVVLVSVAVHKAFEPRFQQNH